MKAEDSKSATGKTMDTPKKLEAPGRKAKDLITGTFRMGVSRAKAKEKPVATKANASAKQTAAARAPSKEKRNDATTKEKLGQRPPTTPKGGERDAVSAHARAPGAAVRPRSLTPTNAQAKNQAASLQAKSQSPSSSSAQEQPAASSRSATKSQSAHERGQALSAHSRKVNGQLDQTRKVSSSRGELLLPGGESGARRVAKKTPSRYEPSPGAYVPPVLSDDSLDHVLNDGGKDRYRTLAAPTETFSLARADEKSHDKPVLQLATIPPPGVRANREATLRNPVSEMTSQTYESHEDEEDEETATNLTSPSHSQKKRGLESFMTEDSEYFPDEGIWSDEDFYVTKQKVAVVCIIVSALQLAILLIQLILCGVATVEVNPLIGPYPDAFSEWGGKNVYLMLVEKQYFRIITPIFLHVGVLHLLINVFCQLETCAFFEREWGSFRWTILYLISGVGAVATSSVASPNDISVCSSGALMGMFGAKLAQIIGWNCFTLRSQLYYESVHLDQLSGVMCSATLVSILSFFTYIDWSSHMGGLAAGFLGGMFIFCRPIESACVRVLWGSTGLIGLLGMFLAEGYLLLYEIYPNLDEELANACAYFRNLYPEGYECDCKWS